MASYPIQPLSKSEVNQLIAACSSRAPTGIRNRALIALLYRSGLRLGEALALKLADLDPDHGAITVRRGKGDKHRIVGMDPDGWAYLQRWLDRRRQLRPPSGAPVFSTLNGGPVSQDYVRQMLARIKLRAGVAKRVHAHGLRHTHLTELAYDGVPLPVIQAQAGHEHITTTARYINQRAPAHQIAIIAGRLW